MSYLTLVRHGQASFFADDYDKLSPLGEEQARRLGALWVKQRLSVDEVYAGPRARQKRTAELVGEGLREAGLAWPEPVYLDELDEYDLHGLQNHLAPQLVERHAEFARMTDVYPQTVIEHDRLRLFQKMFEILLSHWQEGGLSSSAFESWKDFQQRVQRVIRRIQNHPGRSRRVLFFTSGGFIGTAAQIALGATDATALELNWRVRNSSLTEFVFTTDRFTLDNFNMTPHLEDPKMWTYR